MVRRRRLLASVVALVLSVGSVFAPRAASADATCDAGAACGDEDHDGFVACSCPFAGTPCDCDDSDPATFPGAPEACDAPKDRNCSGVVADKCPLRRGCLGSVCVPECIPLDDFGCAVGSTLTTQPSGECLCAPKDCSLFGCPPGSTCDDANTCVPSCPPGVRCPLGQLCRGSGCVDPCAEVTCPNGGACAGGLCVTACACCPAGETCDPSAAAPTCVERACAGVACDGGKHCEHGACIDDCEGVVCPPMRVCRLRSVNGRPPHGECVDLCTPSPCKPGFSCDWRTGACTPRPTAGGGITDPDPLGDPLEIAGGGWRCSATALTRASATTALVTAAAALGLILRRRRRRGARGSDAGRR